MDSQFFEKPILNSPYDYPARHWELDKTGQPTQRVQASRLRMVLRGGYIEEYLPDPEWGPARPAIMQPWRPHWFPTKHAHRITMVKPGTVSLVVVGRKKRTWGFWRPTADPSTYGDLMAASLGASVTLRPRAEWVDYRDALDLRPTEGVTG